MPVGMGDNEIPIGMVGKVRHEMSIGMVTLFVIVILVVISWRRRCCSLWVAVIKER